MYCYKCGKEVSTDMKFCPYCGTSVLATATSTETVGQTVNEDKLYDIVLIDLGKQKVKVLKDLTVILNISLSDASMLVSQKYCRIAERLTFDNAFEMAAKFENDGVVVEVVENGVPYTPKVISSINSKSTASKRQPDMAKHKKRHLITAIFDLASAACITLSCLFVFFLPLFSTIDGNTSMFNRCAYILKEIDLSEINSYTLYIALPVLFAAYIVAIGIRAVFALVKSIKKVANFEVVYERDILNAKPENIMTFLENKKRAANTLAFELVGDVAFFYMISGYPTFIMSRVILCAVFIAASYVCQTVAKYMKSFADKAANP